MAFNCNNGIKASVYSSKHHKVVYGTDVKTGKANVPVAQVEMSDTDMKIGEDGAYMSGNIHEMNRLFKLS